MVPQERNRTRLAERARREIAELERLLEAQRVALFGGSGACNHGSAS